MNKEKVKKGVCQSKRFNLATKEIEYCNRPTHKKSKYCIFHASAEEKTEKEFIEALKEYVDKIKEEDKDYDFRGFIFVGHIDFRNDLNITSFNNANFQGANFKGYIDFAFTNFKGNADFRHTKFEDFAEFGGANFEVSANFGHADFQVRAEFDGTNFKTYAFFEFIKFGYADFTDANFEGYAEFSDVKFKEGAEFRHANFEEDVNFMNANLKGDTDFSYANFKGDADFKAIKIKGNMRFYNSVFTYSKTLLIDIMNKYKKNKITIDFQKTYLENVFLELDLGGKTLINFAKVILRNTIIEKKQIKNHILQEEIKDFQQAKKIYLLLKNNFHGIGEYEDESWAFMKEKEMERKGNCHFKTLHKWLWSCFLNGIFGYGDRPVRVIMSAILIILVFAYLFMISGISNASMGGFTSKNFLDCIYFSVITFTTLGYGDFRPLEGCGRVFAGTEAFIGALMMALFIYIFARRIGGR